MKRRRPGMQSPGQGRFAEIRATAAHPPRGFTPGRKSLSRGRFRFQGEAAMKIAVAGIGYVGLSIAVLLAQRHQVVALVNARVSPIQPTRVAAG